MKTLLIVHNKTDKQYISNNDIVDIIKNNDYIKKNKFKIAIADTNMKVSDYTSLYLFEKYHQDVISNFINNFDDKNCFVISFIENTNMRYHVMKKFRSNFDRIKTIQIVDSGITDVCDGDYEFYIDINNMNVNDIIITLHQIIEEENINDKY